MNTSNSAQTEQNQTQSMIYPDFGHRNLCSDVGDAFGFYENINRGNLLAKSIINLNKSVFYESSDGQFDRDSAYYSHLSVKMLYEDIRAINGAYQEATDSNEQEQPEAGNSGRSIHLVLPAISADILEAIDQITLQAVNALGSFCDLLAGDEPIKIGQFVGAIDLVMQEIANIEAVVSNSRNRLA